MSKAKAKKRFRNALGEARLCGCGGVNVVMGPMTLHFAAEEVDALLDLATGARELRDEATEEDAGRSEHVLGRTRGPVNRPLH